MAPVIMLDIPAGPDFVVGLQRVWDAGGAAFPVDQRLPEAEHRRVVATIGPTHVIDANGEIRSLDGGRPTEVGDALVMATSGTTGHPKGVVLTHDAVAASAEATSKAVGADPGSDTWLACLPPAHVGGLSVITRALHTGTPLITHSGFSADRVLAAADDGATLVSLVTRALAEVDPARFRVVVIGGAAPPPDRPDNVVATYGMTETGSGIVYERRPIDGVELRIGADEEVEVRGPMLLRSYRDADRDHDPFTIDGWFPTGDLGTILDDGSLRVFGRAGNVITTGGEKVWPERVEQLLQDHPDVADLAVTGRPHPQWGNEVIALVVPVPGRTVDLEALRSAVKAQLPVWYAPRSLLVVDSIPRTALGKIRRPAVSALADDS